MWSSFNIFLVKNVVLGGRKETVRWCFTLFWILNVGFIDIIHSVNLKWHKYCTCTIVTLSRRDACRELQLEGCVCALTHNSVFWTDYTMDTSRVERYISHSLSSFAVLPNEAMSTSIYTSVLYSWIPG